MKYIFITGLGRSGTSFVTALLSKIQGVHVGHENTGSKEFRLLSWYLKDTNYATEYLKRVKLKIESSINSEWYIDSDSYLQNATDELQQVFQPETIFHLVRHPKDVIGSTYIWRNENEIHLMPKKDNEIQRWMQGDRFEQICWNWKNTVENLLNKNIPLIKLEDLTSDYDYFDKKLLKPFGFDIRKTEWEQIKNVKVNKRRSRVFRYFYAKLKGKSYQSDALPEYSGWSENHKKIFTEYCLPAMTRLGYTL